MSLIWSKHVSIRSHSRILALLIRVFGSTSNALVVVFVLIPVFVLVEVVILRFSTFEVNTEDRKVLHNK